MSSSAEEVRLDKWLWAARFYKTRSLARNMVEGGKVHYNGQRAKPSKSVEIGAQITLRQGHDEKTIIIEKISTNAVGHLKHNSSIAKRPKASPNVNAMP